MEFETGRGIRNWFLRRNSKLYLKWNPKLVQVEFETGSAGIRNWHSSASKLGSCWLVGKVGKATSPVSWTASLSQAATSALRRPLAATSSHRQRQPPTGSDRQPQAATGSHRQEQAAIGSHSQPQAATASHSRPHSAQAATGSNMEPQAAT